MAVAAQAAVKATPILDILIIIKDQQSSLQTRLAAKIPSPQGLIIFHEFSLIYEES
jgi:hypothetical protein